MTLKLQFFITARNELRQGNVFTPVCHSVHRVGVSVQACTTGHMTRGVSVQGRGVSVRGGLCLGWSLSQRPPPCTVTRGPYAYYWNAFLFYESLRLSNSLVTFCRTADTLSSITLKRCKLKRKLLHTVSFY